MVNKVVSKGSKQVDVVDMKDSVVVEQTVPDYVAEGTTDDAPKIVHGTGTVKEDRGHSAVVASSIAKMADVPSGKTVFVSIDGSIRCHIAANGVDYMAVPYNSGKSTAYLVDNENVKSFENHEFVKHSRLIKAD